MNSALILWLAMQGVQPAPEQADAPSSASAQAAARDVYTACFFEQLSRLEGRDFASSTAEFSIRNASTALRSCQPAKAQLSAAIERQLAADPSFADNRHRKIELENRVALTELPLLLLVHARGR